VTQRARGEYALDTASFDELHEVARRVAHVIARDILRQFEAGTPPGKR
jgi:hypothetical protein